MSPSRTEALDQQAAFAAAVAAFLLIANQVAARAVRDALFLSAFEVRSLPLVMGAAAVSALAGAELLSYALARRSPARVVPAAAALSAALLAVWWAVGLFAPQAAALPLTTITAWELLFDRLRVLDNRAPSQRSLLVIGAAGGVGSILVQLARQLTGLTVIGTASRPETQAWVRELGAHHVIDHAKPLAAELKRLGFDHVSDIAALTHTDKHFPQIAEAIAPQGRVAVIDGARSAATTIDGFRSTTVGAARDGSSTSTIRRATSRTSAARAARSGSSSAASRAAAASAAPYTAAGAS